MSQTRSESTPPPAELRQEFIAEYQALLKGWLDQEQERQSLTQRLFSDRESTIKLQDLLDQNDRQREFLIVATRQILELATPPRS